MRDEKNSRTPKNYIWPKFDKISLLTEKFFKIGNFCLIFSVLEREMSNNVENEREKVDPITNCKSAGYIDFRYWFKSQDFHDL